MSSINRRMEKVQILEKIEYQNEFGEMIAQWNSAGFIEMAISKNSDVLYTNSQRYNLSDYTGITDYRGLKVGLNRIVWNGLTLDITSVAEVRRTVLLLKGVDVNV